MSVPPLLYLAERACIRNISSITDIGDIPYKTARPFLLKVETPYQLREIEVASPQIRGHDGEIWLEFIKRDVPNWEQKPHEPRNPLNWYLIYRNLYRDSLRELELDAKILKAQMEGIKSESQKHRLKHVSPADVPRLPKMGGMKYSNPNIVYPKTKKFVADDKPKLTFQTGSKTKLLTGKGVIDKSRREAKELSLFSKGSHLAVPTHKLNERSSVIPFAPKNMIYDYQQPVPRQLIDPTVKPPPVFAPKRKRVEHPELLLPAQAKSLAPVPGRTSAPATQAKSLTPAQTRLPASAPLKKSFILPVQARSSAAGLVTKPVTSTQPRSSASGQPKESSILPAQARSSGAAPAPELVIPGQLRPAPTTRIHVPKRRQVDLSESPTSTQIMASDLVSTESLNLTVSIKSSLSAPATSLATVPARPSTPTPARSVTPTLSMDSSGSIRSTSADLDSSRPLRHTPMSVWELERRREEKKTKPAVSSPTPPSSNYAMRLSDIPQRKPTRLTHGMPSSVDSTNSASKLLQTSKGPHLHAPASGIRPLLTKKKAPVDIFIPVKRRRLS